MSLKAADRLNFKYPQMRDELLETMRTLSDLEYQWSAWVNHNFPPGVQHDEFDYAVHFLYDDSSLAEAPERAIGLFVKDQHEVHLIKAVISALDQVFDALGMECTDEQYISSPLWAEVLRTASEASHAMSGKQLSVG